MALFLCLSPDLNGYDVMSRILGSWLYLGVLIEDEGQGRSTRWETRGGRAHMFPSIWWVLLFGGEVSEDEVFW